MENFIFSLDENLKKHYKNAKFGILAIKGVDNKIASSALYDAKTKLELELRKKFKNFTRKNLDQFASIKPYSEYYKSFEKTYHVRLQLESILLGKNIPLISPLVTSMFMAEMKNQLLTAGHDLNVCEIPLRAGIGENNKSYILMNGEIKNVKQNDMYIADNKGVISSIILGPDQRTKITPKTTNAIFIVYAPSGIEKEAIIQHLKNIEEYVLLTNTKAKRKLINIYND